MEEVIREADLKCKGNCNRPTNGDHYALDKLLKKVSKVQDFGIFFGKKLRSALSPPSPLKVHER